MRNSSGWDIGYSSPDSDGNRRSYSDQESSDPGENMSVHFWSAPAPFKGLRALALESCYMDLSQLQVMMSLTLCPSQRLCTAGCSSWAHRSKPGSSSSVVV